RRARKLRTGRSQTAAVSERAYQGTAGGQKSTWRHRQEPLPDELPARHRSDARSNLLRQVDGAFGSQVRRIELYRHTIARRHAATAAAERVHERQIGKLPALRVARQQAVKVFGRLVAMAIVNRGIAGFLFELQQAWQRPVVTAYRPREDIGDSEAVPQRHGGKNLRTFACAPRTVQDKEPDLRPVLPHIWAENVL